MGSDGVSLPMRLMCGGAALLFGYLAIEVAVTGEMPAHREVIELSPLVRCIPVAIFAVFSLVAGWVAVTGRE